MRAARVVIAIAVGIVFTAIGFSFGTRVLHAPVWFTSFVFTKAGVAASNAVMNLTYLGVNIGCWALITYVILAKFATRAHRT